MTSGRDAAPHYLLGHDPRELRRLDMQGRLYREVTVRALVEAGVRPGMRVLDIGCGSGDVSAVAAEVVGPGGEVVGIDRGEAAVMTARERASAAGLTNVSFHVGEVGEAGSGSRIGAGGRFDALVGRFVLMHQRDPSGVLAAAVRAVEPGGPVVMIESWMELIRSGHSEPHSPLYDEIVRFKCDVVEAAGADVRAGGRLRRIFVDAGLPPPVCRLDARVEGGSESAYYEYVAESVRSMRPEARRSGVSGFETDGDVEDVAARLRREVTGADGVLVVWPVVYGISRAMEAG